MYNVDKIIEFHQPTIFTVFLSFLTYRSVFSRQCANDIISHKSSSVRAMKIVLFHLMYQKQKNTSRFNSRQRYYCKSLILEEKSCRQRVSANNKQVTKITVNRISFSTV